LRSQPFGRSRIAVRFSGTVVDAIRRDHSQRESGCHEIVIRTPPSQRRLERQDNIPSPISARARTIYGSRRKGFRAAVDHRDGGRRGAPNIRDDVSLEGRQRHTGRGGSRRKAAALQTDNARKPDGDHGQTDPRSANRRRRQTCVARFDPCHSLRRNPRILATNNFQIGVRGRRQASA